MRVSACRVLVVTAGTHPVDPLLEQAAASPMVQVVSEPADRTPDGFFPDIVIESAFQQGPRRLYPGAVVLRGDYHYWLLALQAAGCPLPEKMCARFLTALQRSWSAAAAPRSIFLVDPAEQEARAQRSRISQFDGRIEVTSAADALVPAPQAFVLASRATPAPALAAFLQKGSPVGFSEGLDTIGFADDLVGTWQLLAAEVVTDVLSRLRTTVVRRIAEQDRCDLLQELPTVEVLLATNRPDMVSRGIASAAAQDYENLRFSIALHGLSTEEQERASAEVERQLQHRAPEARIALPECSQDLGTVLNTLSSGSSAALLTKMDDDDLYSAEHIRDLVQLHLLSGADVVGRAAEFVYFEEADLLARRFTQEGFARSWLINGGAMMWTRSVANQVPFPRLRTGVDRKFLDDCRDSRFAVYRGAPHAYVLTRRSAAQHTWTVPPDYFFAQAAGAGRGKRGLPRLSTETR